MKVSIAGKNEEFIERINKEAYTNRRWAVENEGLLTNEQYKKYLELTKGRITGEEKWMITDIDTGDNLVKVDDWLVQSDGDFANAPIKALYKVKREYRNEQWRILYERTTKGKSISQQINDYLVESGYANKYTPGDFADYSPIKELGRNDSKNAKNSGHK